MQCVRQMRLQAVAFDSHSKTLELQDEREKVYCSGPHGTNLALSSEGET